MSTRFAPCVVLDSTLMLAGKTCPHVLFVPLAMVHKVHSSEREGTLSPGPVARLAAGPTRSFCGVWDC